MTNNVTHQSVERRSKNRASYLCVDLDGTLIRSDLLFELLVLLVKQRPLLLLRMPFWLLKGKAHLKAQLAARVKVDVGSLPYRDDLVTYLTEEHMLGRRLVLATAADARVAGQVAKYLGLFEFVVASDGLTNISGARKAEALEQLCGKDGFTYIGDAPVDKAVWQRAQGSIVVGKRQHLARTLPHIERTFPESSNPKNLLRAMRTHQWVKNVLIFVPLLLAHQVTNLPLIASALLAFLSFSLCASSVYIQNDLLDLESDRKHRSKRFRPFASGALSIRFGLLLAPFLLFAAFGVALLLPLKFLGVLAAYFATTLAYSFFLKHKPIVDVLTLALLYVVRIVAGAVAIGATLSPWLLAFAMFFFLSLAYVKRYAELRALEASSFEPGAVLRARGYEHSDLEGLADLGVSSGYISALVIALYINSSAVREFYSNPAFLWLICPLIVYWLSRVWLLARRGKMHDDPIVFALSDRISYLVGGLAITAAILAAWLPLG